jgi:hypothetical protein
LRVPRRLLSSGAAESALTIIVTADDRTILRCTPRQVGGVLVPRQWRWVLVEPSGIEHVGPLYSKANSPDAVRRQLSGWWAAKTELERTHMSVLITGAPTALTSESIGVPALLQDGDSPAT